MFSGFCLSKEREPPAYIGFKSGALNKHKKNIPRKKKMPAICLADIKK